MATLSSAGTMTCGCANVLRVFEARCTYVLSAEAQKED